MSHNKRISSFYPNLNPPITNYNRKCNKWIIAVVAVITTFVCVSVEVGALPFPSRITNWNWEPREQNDNRIILPNPPQDENDPNLRIGQYYGEIREVPEMAAAQSNRNNFALNDYNGGNDNAIAYQHVASVRQAREAPNIRHYDRIPVRSQPASVRRGTIPPADEDEDDSESLEANREAFLEILDDHAKHPHRHRSAKHRNNKMQLKYDFETKRYSITEQQSDEW